MSLQRHLSEEPSPADRGRAFGTAHRQAVENTVAVYRRLFAESCELGPSDVQQFGEDVEATLASRLPGVLEEIAGIASGANVSTAELVAINARTELLAGQTEPECTVVACQPHSASAPCLFAQTWDWHPALEASRVVWTVHAEGRWFVTLTEAGILAKLGLNSAGLACGLNFLTSSVDGGASGIPIHILLRLLLGECSTPGDALRLLLNTKTSASSCITISFADSEAAVIFGVELSPAGARVVPTCDRGTFVHTNHFLAKPHDLTDVGLVEWPGTLVRFQHVKRKLAELDAAPNEQALTAILKSHFAAPDSVCKHEIDAEPWPERRRTLVAVLLNLTDRTFNISDGPPCEAAWQRVPLPADRAELHAPIVAGDPA